MYLKYLADKRRKQINNEPKVSALGVVMRWKRPSLPTPAQKPTPTVTPSNKLYVHYLNDPTTPELVKSDSSIPAQLPQNPFTVYNFVGPGQPQGTVQFQATHAYITVGETLNLANGYAGSKKIPKWARTKTLSVVPRAGIDLNAYYDGQSLKFFQFTDSRIGGSVYAVDSADIVSHECGHAILDCYRPDLWDAAFIEVGSFHEAFGDFIAIMHSMSHDEILLNAIAETSGNMSLSNVISRLAEQFGRAIYRLSPNGRNQNYLRSAINDFRYVNPNTLPEDAADNQLAAEVHSFSRVFTGALWDILVMLYSSFINEGNNQINSLKLARDWVCRYMMAAIQNAPVNAKFFESVAKTILWADTNLQHGKFTSQIRQIFIARNILTNEVRMLSGEKCPNDEGIVTKHKFSNLKLSDCLVSAQSNNDNPLYSVELSIPQEEVKLYDSEGNLFEEVCVSDEESLNAAAGLVNYLHKTQTYGSGDKTPWEVRDGKLIRTRTCCY